MTLGHITILTAMAMLAAVPLFISMYSATTSGTPAAHMTVCLVGTLVGWCALLLASSRFVFAAARPDHQFNWPGTLTRGAVILALQIGLTFFVAFAMANRCATIGAVVTCAASTVALLAISLLIARYIGVLRRPYDEWLTLEVTE